jgi:hypothetical protein
MNIERDIIVSYPVLYFSVSRLQMYHHTFSRARLYVAGASRQSLSRQGTHHCLTGNCNAHKIVECRTKKI